MFCIRWCRMPIERNRTEEPLKKAGRIAGRAGKLAAAGGLSVLLTAVPISEARGQARGVQPKEQYEHLPIPTLERLADSIHVAFDRYNRDDTSLPPDISSKIWRAFGERHGMPDSNSYRIEPGSNALRFLLPGMTKGGTYSINLEWARKAIRALASEELRRISPYSRIDSVTVKTVTGTGVGPNARQIITRIHGSQPTNASAGYPYKVGRTARNAPGKR